MSRPRAVAWGDRSIDLGLPALVGLIIMGPVVLGRGYALHGDMVFVPRQPWKDAWLGLDGAAPRFVPGDAIVSVASMAVPGEVVQKIILLGALLLAGAGAARLVSSCGRVGRAAAVLLFVWNPWVLERLSIGQWGSVVGYAALPWLVLAAARARADWSGTWPALTLWLGFCALWSPPAGILAALTAVAVVVVGRNWIRTALTLAIGVVVNLTWLVPALVAAEGLSASGGPFSAFAARAESDVGVLASVLSFGGIWKASVVPGERSNEFVVLAAGVSTVLAVVWLWRRRADRAVEDRRTTTGLAGLTLMLFLLCVAPSLTVVASGLDHLASRAPALAILRDGHRFLGAAVLVLLPGVALAADAIWRAARPGRESLKAVAVLVAALPVLCLPSMAWGLGGELDPVSYPDEWSSVARTIEADVDERGGATVVLPWRGTYRGFAWNDRRAVLDPAPRFFAGEVWIDDRIYLGDQTLGHEDARLARVTAALAAGDPAAELAALGVTRVLIHAENGVRTPDVPRGDTVHEGEGLRLVSLPLDEGLEPLNEFGASATTRSVIVIADAAVLSVWVVAMGWFLRRRVYGDRASEPGRGQTQ